MSKKGVNPALPAGGPYRASRASFQLDLSEKREGRKEGERKKGKGREGRTCRK